jgi:hypothetical protein
VPAFDDDFAAADSLLTEAFGGSVVYLAGSSQITVTAEVVMRDYQIEDFEGLVTTVQSRDYLIDSAALGIDPKPGHRIQLDPPRIADYRASVPDIADALRALMTNPDLRRKMGEAGRTRVVEHFDYRVVARKLVGILSTRLGIA